MNDLPVHNTESEAAVLGSMMLDNDCIQAVRATLVAEDFYAPANQRVYEAIEKLEADDWPCDLMTVSDALRAAGHLEKIGGMDYVLTLLEAVPSAANAEYYASIVRHCSVRRAMCEVGEELDTGARDPTEPANERIFEARGKLTELEVKWLGRPKFDAEAIAQIVIDQLAGTSHVLWRTGLFSLDDLTGGMAEGSHIIIGGRSGHCKTALACVQLTMATWEAGRRVLMARYEETPETIFRRIAAQKCGMSHTAAYKGKLWGPDRDKFAAAVRWVAEQPLTILSGPSLAEIEATVKDVQPGLVIFDTLQKMGHRIPTIHGKRHDLHIERMVDFGGALAAEYRLNAVSLSQVKRGERKHDGPPRSDDLRETGGMFEGADMCLMVWWPVKDDPGKKDIAQYMDFFCVDVTKNRGGGETRRLWFKINRYTQELKELAKDEQDEIREFHDPSKGEMR